MAEKSKSDLELTEEEALEKGDRARSLLQNPLFQECTLKVEENLIMEWRNAKTPLLREQAHAKLFGLMEVLQILKNLFERGEVLKKLEEGSADVEARTSQTEEN